MTRITHLSYALLILFLSVFVLTSAHAAPVTWTQQPGTVYWYKSGTVNKYPSTNPADFTIPVSWKKQDDKIYVTCLSSGGSKRYFVQGTDCQTGKPVITTLSPPADAVACAVEGKYCTIPVGTKATVWYGLKDKWIVKENVITAINCSNDTFGKDPISGEYKKCVYKLEGGTVVVPPVVSVPSCATYICSLENGEFIVNVGDSQVQKCPAFKITATGQLQTWDAAQAIWNPQTNTADEQPCPKGTYQNK